jgi:hypothetical protein
VFSNTGTGFTSLVNLSTGGDLRPDGVTTGDIDADGDSDIIAATGDDSLGEFASVYRNLGGSFSGMTNYPTGGLNASDVIAPDLNCDGLADIIVVNEDSNNLAIIRNGGGGVFVTPAMLVGVGTTPEELGFGDLDGDGDTDFAVANRNSNNISVVMNQTCATAPDADIDNDGDVDVDDLLAVIAQWGACPAPPAACPANIVNTGTSAGRVDVDDLLAVISNWG